jgi:anthranilate/para-aminobenzoate synthase component I
MPTSAIVVDVVPDPVAIAQRLAGRPGFAFLHGSSDSERGARSFVAIDPVESVAALLPPRGQIEGASSSAFIGQRGSNRAGVSFDRDTRAGVPRWIGAIPYECGRAIERAAWTRTPDDRPAPHLEFPRWNRYGAVVEVDSARGVVRVVGDDFGKVVDLAREVRSSSLARRVGAPVRLAPLPEDDPAADHLDRIRRAKELIGAGDLYQVNLARRQRFAVDASPLDVYLAIADRAAAPFGACLDLGGTFALASSPELFLAVDPTTGRLETAPIKGTRPRGLDAASDAAFRRELDESPKERAELTMILDVERNDLGRVAVPGSVRLVRGPEVSTHPTVHHRGGILEAVLRPDKSALDAVGAMFPSGSVTGAPKARAMEVIARLEPARRGLYTGALGYVAWDGSIVLAMAIRVLTMRRGEAHYFAGGGIVADSDPRAELDETRWKAAQIERLEVAALACT